MATLRTRRLGRRVFRDDIAVADVFHDVVTVRRGGVDRARLDEVEIELLPAGGDDDIAGSRRPCDGRGRWSDERPKVFRVLDLTAAGAMPIAADATPEERVAAMLAHRCARCSAPIRGAPWFGPRAAP